ncbi:methyl-accepting chemotaxis protein [Phenylobacterium sp.]|uniref:HAMP domain-containing methyl-accepting chemotaxis protein n=1 Tax=Phenylobacterium sp. TaxID=1871053 RepID=UPI0035B1AE0E
MLFNNLKISRKLAISFAAIILTICGMGAVTLVNLHALDQARQATANSRDTMIALINAKFYLSRQENSFRGFLLSLNPYYTERADKHRANFKAQMKRLRELADNNSEVEAKAVEAEAAADKWFDQIVVAGAKLATDPATHQQAVDLVGPDGVADGLIAPAEDAMEAILEIETKHMAAINAEQKATARTAYTVMLSGIAVVMLIAIVFGWMLTRAIARPVSVMTRAMRRLADGDHDVEVPAAGRSDEVGEMAAAVTVFKDAAIAKLRLEGQTVEQRRAAEAERARNEAAKAAAAEAQAKVVHSLADGLERVSQGDLTTRLGDEIPEEYLKLKNDFNAAMNQLQDAMRVVASNVAGIRSGIGEITQASDNLARRTEQQAASLEETAAALDEITATVRKTAEGAKQASGVVVATRTDAHASGEVVSSAVDAMSGIEQSSRQISQIIGVIDEIAFQTNLLALNAGVEAARAGEAGRGFAVVASEVRALAQRSAEAAKEIKTLISASSEQVEAGVDLVGKTGEALERIVSQVAEIDSLVAEIAASAQEQATGLQQVNTAVNQMDQVTQQNAAMVEESTAAAHGLNSEADSLANSVGRFRLGEPPAASRAGPRPATPSQPRPTPQLRTTAATGSAAPKMEPEADGWEEF